jgi:hypothetical protein
VRRSGSRCADPTVIDVPSIRWVEPPHCSFNYPPQCSPGAPNPGIDRRSMDARIGRCGGQAAGVPIRRVWPCRPWAGRDAPPLRMVERPHYTSDHLSANVDPGTVPRRSIADRQAHRSGGNCRPGDRVSPCHHVPDPCNRPEGGPGYGQRKPPDPWLTGRAFRWC